MRISCSETISCIVGCKMSLSDFSKTSSGFYVIREDSTSPSYLCSINNDDLIFQLEEHEYENKID
jgi:hypothetical protein